MNISDAGAPVHHRTHARHHLAAVAIGVGALLGSAGVASARPVHDWAPPVSPRAPAADWGAIAELLPSSMVTVRAALLDGGPGAESGRHVYVSPGGQVVSIDSATQSYIARGRAAQEDRPVTPARLVERGDAKDHPGYGGSHTVHRPVYRPVWLS
jgi:hypothetical protein